MVYEGPIFEIGLVCTKKITSIIRWGQQRKNGWDKENPSWCVCTFCDGREEIYFGLPITRFGEKRDQVEKMLGLKTTLISFYVARLEKRICLLSRMGIRNHHDYFNCGQKCKASPINLLWIKFWKLSLLQLQNKKNRLQLQFLGKFWIQNPIEHKGVECH